MKEAELLTPAEFELLQILWGEERSLSVGEVLRRLHRSVAYTTVMTVLDKLARKGSVSQVKRGKAYFYRPLVKRQDVLQRLVEEFANDYFQGSRRKLNGFLKGRSGRSNADWGPPTDAPPSDEITDELDVALL